MMRAVLMIWGLVFFSFPAFAEKDAVATMAADRFLGSATATVEILEFSSLTCPSCARYHQEIIPKIKQDFIETGKARIVFRDFPFDQLGVMAAMVTRCADPERYFPFITILLTQQTRWTRADEPITALKQIARFAGVTPEKFDQCVNNEALLNAILERRMEAVQNHAVQATPTIKINGVKVEDPFDYKKLAKLINDQLVSN